MMKFWNRRKSLRNEWMMTTVHVRSLERHCIYPCTVYEHVDARMKDKPCLCDD